MSIKTKKTPPAPKITKEWIAGYVAGRFEGDASTKIPPFKGRALKDWEEAYMVGLTHKHYQDETLCREPGVNHAVLDMRRAAGEKV